MKKERGRGREDREGGERDAVVVSEKEKEMTEALKWE